MCRGGGEVAAERRRESRVSEENDNRNRTEPIHLDSPGLCQPGECSNVLLHLRVNCSTALTVKDYEFSTDQTIRFHIDPHELPGTFMGNSSRRRNVLVLLGTLLEP